MSELREFERFVVGNHVVIEDGSEWVLTAAAVNNPWAWVSGDSDLSDQMLSNVGIRQRQGRLVVAVVHVDGGKLLHYAAEQCLTRAKEADEDLSAAWSVAAAQLRELVREGWGADVALSGPVTRSGP